MILERERIEGLETMERALEHYGTNAQMLKCIEMMGKLSRALARALNPNEQTDQANICEEIANVSIMLDQLYLHFGKEYIMRLKLSKLKRLKKLMDAENREEDEEEPENETGDFRSDFWEAMIKLKDAIDMATRNDHADD